MDKLRIILGACGIHLCIGSVYAWSVLTNPIMEYTGWSLSHITFTFSLAILFLGFSAAYWGKRVQRWGPKTSAATAMLFYVIGMLGSAYAIEMRSLILLYIFYGCIGGIGLGIGYIAPISTLLKWFPDAKGFAGGCAVMSFGFSAMISGPVMNYFISEHGLIYNFIIMSAICAVIMLISVRLIELPPESYTYSSKYNYPVVVYKKKEGEKKEYTPEEAIRTVDFWVLWIVFFINISAGISILSIASPMVEEMGMNAAEAAGMVGMTGILNGGGRMFYASISDHIGRKLTYYIMFLMQLCAFLLLAGTNNPYMFQSLVFIIVTCYGGGFSCMPAYLSDLFGDTHISEIHGRILTAWGFAGLSGPLLLTVSHEVFGTYNTALYIFSALFVVSLLIMGYIRRPV